MIRLQYEPLDKMQLAELLKSITKEQSGYG